MGIKNPLKPAHSMNPVINYGKFTGSINTQNPIKNIIVKLKSLRKSK